VYGAQDRFEVAQENRKLVHKEPFKDTSDYSNVLELFYRLTEKGLMSGAKRKINYTRFLINFYRTAVQSRGSFIQGLLNTDNT
jgi:hypothetical protein